MSRPDPSFSPAPLTTDRHTVLIVEDDPQNAQTLRDIVGAMDMDCRVVATLEEVRALLASGFAPCAILQDMQIPFAAGARPHEEGGESSIGQVRGRWKGKRSVAIVVVTGFRADPDFVWAMSELDADGFCAKANIETLPEKLRAALKKRGRERHADCAECNAESRVVESMPRGAARVFSNEYPRGRAIGAEEVEAIVKRRAEHDLFLDYASIAGTRGYLAGFRDHRRIFREAFLAETSAAILAELVEAGKPIRADALRRLRHGGHVSAVRLVQKARKEVDVHVMMRGRESAREWRAFHTVGGKGATAFVFEPPAGKNYAVLVREGAARQ